MEVFIMIILIIFVIVLTISGLQKEKEKTRSLQERYSLPKNSEDIRKVIIINIDYNGIILNSDGLNNFHSNMWKDKNHICFIGTVVSGKDYGKIEIPIDNIEYFTRAGDCYTNIEGGGSKLSGAVVGAAIAGEAGAVIGSRKKVETNLVDKRITIMKVLDKNKNEKIIKFHSNDYEAFLNLIPEKEKSLQNSNNIEKENNMDGNIQAICKLDELRKKGILSEEEFSTKKKQLLAKI
ncbi:MAG: SHOCT domain-containing protein [Clostridium botulinum]|nr:SHOCT domain-containing protein [Clostridium botulinum]